ncbi:MAG: group III truncated hemoglobin [Cyclobacteriaceae bacterium]|nr:group III truncated hemoglobin [Cyclobacteriaceae bacterium]
MLKDIENSGDIRFLIDEFYKKVVKDDLIGHFFTRVIKLDWDKHIPVMNDFWETILLGKVKYKGNPMLKHIELNGKEPLNAEHFDRWLALWETTVTGNFSGITATEAIQRARHIADLMKYKIQQHGIK